MIREHLNPDILAPPPGYSQVVKVTDGTTIYLAGQVAWDRDRNIVGENDFEAQTRQVFHNVAEALAAVGAGFGDLVKIGIYVVDHDMEKMAIVRRVRDEIMDGITPPASTLLGVEALAVPGLMIEIDAIAVVNT
ncbi:MAG TPA: RidA family protein [Acidimicrobiia bacterium]|nr:RidA family protein [Acidimicrobiia bacterium]